jgi:hypothetical protein
MLADENCTVIPAGSAPVERAIDDVNPPAAVIVMAVAAEPPAAMVTLDGVAASVNDAFDSTVTGRLTEFVMLPLVPVIMIE